MKSTLISTFAMAMIAVIVSSAHGALVISEVVFNEVGSDTTGEWIEIFNAGGATIDLTNYKIGDEETSGGTGAGESVVRFPAGASIASGSVQIVAVSASRFNEVYGFLPTYEINATVESVSKMLPYAAWDPDGGVFNMANTNDHALLLDELDNIVDSVNWGNSTFLNPGLPQPVADGQSYERVNAYVDTDAAADWQLGPTNTVAALRSTPGTVPVPEPTALSLLTIAVVFGLTAHRRK